MTSLRMPVSAAARKGISGIAVLAAEQTVVLTSDGRAVAAVDSPARAAQSARLVREARLAVLDAAGHLAGKCACRLSLDEACGRLGLDAQRVRDRASAMLSWTSSALQHIDVGAPDEPVAPEGAQERRAIPQ